MAFRKSIGSRRKTWRIIIGAVLAGGIIYAIVSYVRWPRYHFIDRSDIPLNGHETDVASLPTTGSEVSRLVFGSNGWAAGMN